MISFYDRRMCSAVMCPVLLAACPSEPAGGDASQSATVTETGSSSSGGASSEAGGSSSSPSSGPSSTALDDASEVSGDPTTSGGPSSSGSSDGGDGDGHGTCGVGGPVGAGGLETVEIGNSFYYIAAPPSDPLQPWPLVVVLHGDEGMPDAVASMWSPLWDGRQDFVLVLPQSPDPSASWWNGDVDANEQFLRSVLADVASLHNIDIERIYATGVSGGSTFLGFRAFRMQDIFAAMQLSCGGGGADYQAPPQPECKIPARFVIAPTDFLYDWADSIRDTMDANGHETAWLDAACDGHCCGPISEYAEGALAWMLEHRKCGGWGHDGCGAIDDLPSP